MKANVNFSEESETNIIRYLNGDLSVNDIKKFEKELKHNVRLRSHTSTIRNIRTILTNPKLVEAEQVLMSLREKNIGHVEINNFKTFNISRLLRPYNIISSILFLLILMAIGTSLLGTKASTLYSTYMEPYPLNIPDGNRAKLEQDAIITYKLATKTNEVNDWKDAQNKLEPLAAKYSKYKIYAVVAHVFSQPNNNLANLEALAKFQGTFSQEEKERVFNKQQFLWIDYYRALIYFNKGKVSEGKNLISKLNNSENIVGVLKKNIEDIQKKIANSSFIY